MATDKITARRTAKSGSDTALGLTLLNRLNLLFLNRVTTDGGMTTGTTPAKAKTLTTIAFTVDGVFYSKAATDDFWTLSGTTVAAAMFQVYHLYIDTAGAASMAEGTQATTLAGVRRPAIPEGKTLVAYITLQTIAATFIPGTTALNAGGQSVTYFDGVDKAVLPLVADSFGGSALADELPAPPV